MVLAARPDAGPEKFTFVMQAIAPPEVTVHCAGTWPEADEKPSCMITESMWLEAGITAEARVPQSITPETPGGLHNKPDELMVMVAILPTT